MLDPKKQPINITLTEPIVFLRTADPSGRHQSDATDPPTLVRGILTLNVTRPIGISSIEVELTGALAINYPEAIGSRRIDLPEKLKIYSSTVTVFRAERVPRGRYSASVGPGLPSANDEREATPLSRMPSLPRGRSERRDFVSIPPDLGPTPPYTPVQPPSIQSRPGILTERPAQTLQELRQSLRENLGGQVDFTLPSCRSSVTLSPVSPMMHSNTSSVSHDSLHREYDNRVDDLSRANLSSDHSTSFHNTAEEISHVPPHSGPSPDCLARIHSPENTNESQPQQIHDNPNTSTGHSRLRLSISSVLGAVREIASRAPSRSRSMARSEDIERGRTRVRIPEEQSRTRIIESSEGFSLGNGQPGPNASHPSSHSEHQERHLFGLGRVLGLERDHNKDCNGEYRSNEHGECWKEFRPGTYSYPISFLLPTHLPPTFTLPNGSFDYTIRGVAHRPGTFTYKLTCEAPLLVVAAPAIGTGEGGGGDPGPLFVEKQWQTKLAYSFGLSSRLFLLGSGRRLGPGPSEDVGENTHINSLLGVGARAEAVYGTVTLDLTLLPIEKVRIWRLDLFVDQRIKYMDERGRPFRDDDTMQVKLIALQDVCPVEEMEEERARKNKHKHKHSFARIPLLPTPISPHRSPLLRHLSPSTDPSILAGPGPYTLSTTIGLPGCDGSSSDDNGPLHFTLKQKSSRVKVEHSLRLVMRVESVSEGDTGNNSEEEKKKLFDIAVQTPINILSCRCVPEYQMLPSYSPVAEADSQTSPVCPCQSSSVGSMGQGHGHGVEYPFGYVTRHSPALSADRINAAADDLHGSQDRLGPPSRGERSHTNSLSGSLHPSTHEVDWNRPSSSHAQHHSHTQYHHGHSHSYSVSTSHVQTHSQTPPFTTPHTSRPPSPLLRYERLVSGLESEAGEAPPSYESVTSGPETTDSANSPN